MFHFRSSGVVRLVLAAFVVALSFPNTTKASDDDCVRGVSSLFSRTTPLKLTGGRGGAKAIRFGFDAELHDVQDVIALVGKSERDWNALYKDIEGDRNFTYSVSKLADMLDVSASTIRNNIITDIDPADGVNFLDVDLSLFEGYETPSKIKTLWAGVATDHVSNSLKRRGIPVHAIEETYSARSGEHAVELVMNGSTDIPSKYASLIGKIHKDTENPQTHHHMSFPASHVSEEQMGLMARALETKVITDMLRLQDEYDGNYAPFDESAIATTVGEDVGRGVVRVDMNRWDEPYAAHDVELREWKNLKHAQELLTFMAKLAVKRDGLLDTSEFKGRHISRSMPPNLNAVLKYIAFIMEAKGTGSASTISKLRSYASRIEGSRSISPAIRREIKNYLASSGINSKIKTSFFME